MEAERRLEELEARLDIKFKRREWLLEAMTHTSWINERGAEGRDNERLEYLGDAVLELVAAEYLFNRFPNYDEGQLTQMRSSLVSTVALAGIGEQLRLGEALRLGRGATKSGARRLTSLHANAFEAIIGATFLDQGYRKAGKIFLSRIGDLSSWTDPNFKGRLQALAQERYGMPPIYRTLPDGNSRPRQYLSQVSVEGGPVLGEGRGGTKQAAEQGAARTAIDGLVAPVSKKRRRGSRSGSIVAAAIGEPLTSASLQAVAADIPLAMAPAAGGGEPNSALGTVVPARKRRRRSRGSGTGATAVPRSPDSEAQQSDPGVATPGSLPALPDSVSASAEPTPARRRRRRSRGGNGGAASGQAVPPAPAVPTPELASAPQVITPVLVVSASASPDPLPNLDEPTDPAQRKRTHRGHRGGRRRSGRPATPTP
jgi:ribonuclease-3